MICLSWNCRSLGNATTVGELRNLAKKYAPTVLCVLETQIHKSRVELLKGTLEYDNSFAVSSSGRMVALVYFGIIKLWKFYRTRNIISMQL